MIPILYSTTETEFQTNGLGRLIDCTKCLVTEERNGVYSVDFEYPVTGRFYDQLIQGGIIGVIHDDKHDVQPFDICSHTAPIDGVVAFHAEHIGYRARKIIISPLQAESLASALEEITSHAANTDPFTLWTDKAVATPFRTTIPKTLRSILMGSEGSLLDVYGKGEYEFDKWDIKLYLNRGQDTDVTIRRGKNLTDIEQSVDRSDTYNAVAPFWIGQDEDGQEIIVTLPETVVQGGPSQSGFVLLPGGILSGDLVSDASGIVSGDLSLDSNGILSSSNSVSQVDAVPLDLSEAFETQPTEEQLRQAATEHLASREPWNVDENIKVDFVQLWQTSEYADYAPLQRVSLCDTISIYDPRLGVIAEKKKVIRVVYDVLRERYDEMELGTIKSTLSQEIEANVSDETNAAIRSATSGMATLSVLQTAIQTATEMITGGRGGHIVYSLNANGQPQEMFILDAENVEQAMSVLRFNRNGIGFSQNGINGPYSTAWTIDGAFNANFITAGVLNANLIRAGTLRSLDGTTFVLDLDAGTLDMDARSIKINGESMSVIIQGQTQPIVDNLADLRAHIIIGSDGSMTFVGADGNPITLRLVNDQLGIYNGGDLIDSFAASGTMTQNLTIPQGGSLSMGNFKWVPRSSGSLDIMWVGG